MKLLFAFLVLISFSVDAAQEADINLTIEGVRSDKGRILISVYDKAEGFPAQPRKSVRVARMSAKPETLTKKFRGLKPGNYAVAFIHDENGNMKLDADADGTPVEGFGFSNNPKIAQGAATFGQSRFVLSAPSTDVKVLITYIDRK